jgi:hypothetical protein
MLRLKVDHCVLVSSNVWGSWPDVLCCLTVTALPCGTPSLTRRQARVTNKDGVILRPTISQPVFPGARPPSGIRNRIIFSFPWKLSLDSYWFFIMGRPLWREDGSVIYSCCWASQRSISRDRVRRDSWAHITLLIWILPQPGGPGSCIYFPLAQDNPLIPLVSIRKFVLPLQRDGDGADGGSQIMTVLVVKMVQDILIWFWTWSW